MALNSKYNPSQQTFYTFDTGFLTPAESGIPLHIINTNFYKPKKK